MESTIASPPPPPPPPLISSLLPHLHFPSNSSAGYVCVQLTLSGEGGVAGVGGSHTVPASQLCCLSASRPTHNTPSTCKGAHSSGLFLGEPQPRVLTFSPSEFTRLLLPKSSLSSSCFREQKPRHESSKSSFALAKLGPQSSPLFCVFSGVNYRVTVVLSGIVHGRVSLWGAALVKACREARMARPG